MASLRVSLFRFAFGDEQKAIDLLRRCLPPELARTLDWSSLRRLTEARPRQAVRRVPSDVLFAGRLRKGQPMLIYCALQYSFVEWRFEVTDMLDRVSTALSRIDDLAIDGQQPPSVLPLWVHVGAKPFVLPVPLTRLFDDAWAPDTPAAFATLLHRVLRADRLHYGALIGRTLSPAELVCLASMRFWRALAGFPAEQRRSIAVWREVLDEPRPVTATSDRQPTECGEPPDPELLEDRAPRPSIFQHLGARPRGPPGRLAQNSRTACNRWAIRSTVQCDDQPSSDHDADIPRRNGRGIRMAGGIAASVRRPPGRRADKTLFPAGTRPTPVAPATVARGGGRDVP